MESGENISPRIVVKYAKGAIKEMSGAFEKDKPSSPPGARLPLEN
jgi:hypothetical protein